MYEERYHFADDDSDADYAEPQHDHTWVAGMMYVADEDLATVAANRKVECEDCEHVAKKGVDY